MTRNPKVVAKKICRPKMKLSLPDIDQSKAAVLNSLRSPGSQRGSRLRITEPGTCRGHIACKRRQGTRCSARKLAYRWGSPPPLAIVRNRNAERQTRPGASRRPAWLWTAWSGACRTNLDLLQLQEILVTVTITSANRPRQKTLFFCA